MKKHNNLWCVRTGDTVIPDKKGNCSGCSAALHELTAVEATQLVDMFEDIAVNRTIAEGWNASDWLFDDEARALAIAKKVLLTGRS
jgi:hypothetical protein